MKHLLATTMRRPPRQKPPLQPISINPHHSTLSSPNQSSSSVNTGGGWDADDEGFMSSSNSFGGRSTSSGERFPSRPLSLAIPITGPYCPRRPDLRMVLENKAPQPWTLSAFMAYLSQNHCLETLEFTMDASRYKKHYETLKEEGNGKVITESEGCEYVGMLWQKLLDAYIIPNGPREVNLPSTVRDELLSLPADCTPPAPIKLDAAVRMVYELMNESVFVPFLNSVSTPTPHPSNSVNSPFSSSDDFSISSEGRPPSNGRNSGRDQSPSISSLSSHSTNYSRHIPHFPQRSHLTDALRRSRNFGAGKEGSSSGGSSNDVGPEMTDDSSTDSPVSVGEPSTPPITPPTSDGFDSASPGEESGWKKMGSKLGLRRSKTGHKSQWGNTSSSSGSGSIRDIDQEGIQ